MKNVEGAPLFSAGTFCCREMCADDIQRLQQFFDANPEYFFAVSGQSPNPDEARKEFEALPPAGWPFEKKWLLGFAGDDQSLVAMANVIAGLLADSVWHIGLFIVATPLHGGGTARLLYDSLEMWMRRQGARWSRLGVVEGNLRAVRFWEKAGYVDLRKRKVELGNQVNVVRVMAKPLTDGTLSEYLSLVSRDRPESP
jgi:GNAT superfamily N-acetyltransferase